MDGNATAEASITPQWLPDSPKTGAPCGNRRTSAGGHFLRNHSLFEFVNAERLSDLIVSLLPRVLRQCALASLGQNRSTYQFAMDTLLLRWLPPPTTAFMLRGAPARANVADSAREVYQWTDWDQIAPYAALAVIAAEDQQFLDHHGFDVEAIWVALGDAGRGKRPVDLEAYEAARLAAVLPNPAVLHVERPSAYVQARQSWIRAQMAQLGGVALIKTLEAP